MLALRESLQTLSERYNVRPADDTADHSYRDYVCIVHCDCNDHYYRLRDCKHIRAFHVLYDAAAAERTERSTAAIPKGFTR